MIKPKLKDDLTELIGSELYSVIQRCEGKWPGNYNIADWIREYKGPENLPENIICLNHFKNEVDSVVSMILMLVDKHVS